MAMAPCPFCGGTELDVVYSEGGTECWIVCENDECMIDGPATTIGCRDPDEDGPVDLEAEAILLWNQRIEPVEMVNNPPHYTSHPSGVQAIEVCEHLSFNLGNAVKYVWRAGKKGDREQDLSKAEWYLRRELARVAGSALDAAACATAVLTVVSTGHDGLLESVLKALLWRLEVGGLRDSVPLLDDCLGLVRAELREGDVPAVGVESAEQRKPE